MTLHKLTGPLVKKERIKNSLNHPLTTFVIIEKN